MNLFTLVGKNIAYRPLANLLNGLAVAISTMLVITLLILSSGVNQGILQQAGKYSLLVGAGGSPSQLLLSTLFHYQQPIGNIPYQLYLELQEDSRVAEVVPWALGDSYRGHRIIGTTDTYLADRSFTQGGTDMSWQPGGAVIGAAVARATGLQLGDTFQGVHGITCSHDHGDADVHDFTYQVVGILAATGTGDDINIYTPLASVWLSHDIDPEKTESLQVTALLINPSGPVSQMELSRELSQLSGIQAIHTPVELRQLLNTLGNTALVASFIAYTALAMAALSLTVSLLATGAERRRDAALLRVLGASRATVVKAIVGESVLITSGGLLVGWLAAHLASHFLGNWITHKSGVLLNAWQLAPGELLTVGAVAILGILAGLISALGIYRTQPTAFLE